MNKMILAMTSMTMLPAQVGAQTNAPVPASPQGAGMQDVSRQQAQQMADSMFQRLDLNHDGTVTRAEADEARTQMGWRGHIIERTFGTAQSLTQAQFEAATLARFDSEDTNHDGSVSVAERQAARAARQAAQGGAHHGERG